MTLLELTEPLFKYVCFLNRSARRGAHVDPAQADAELEGILSDMRSKAASAAGVVDQYEKVELPLIFFVDNVIAGSPYSFAESYQRLAYKRDRVTGDDDFCDELDKTLAEPENVSSSERLALFYTCIGLGFMGGKLEEPTLRQKTMSRIARRIKPMMEMEDRTRITPQAYKYTLTDDLIPPPVKPIWLLAVALAAFIVVAIMAMPVLYRLDTAKLHQALAHIQQEAQP